MNESATATILNRTEMLDVVRKLCEEKRTIASNAAESELNVTAARANQKADALERILAEHQVMYNRLVGRPDLMCQKCGYFVNGSGQWACKNCGVWHYWTGSFAWPVETPQAQAWLEQAAAGVDAYLAGRVDAHIAPIRQGRPAE